MLRIVLVENVERETGDGWGWGYVMIPADHWLYGFDTDTDAVQDLLRGDVTFAGEMNGCWALGFHTTYLDNTGCMDVSGVLAQAEKLRKEIEDYEPCEKTYRYKDEGFSSISYEFLSND